MIDLEKNANFEDQSPWLSVEPPYVYLLYALMRCSQPKTIVEIGCGQGFWTQAILKAMEGWAQPARPVCVDVRDVLAPNFKDRVDFRQLDWETFWPQMPKTDAMIVDLAESLTRRFFDERVWPFLNPGGWFLCHDTLSHPEPKALQDSLLASPPAGAWVMPLGWEGLRDHGEELEGVLLVRKA